MSGGLEREVEPETSDRFDVSEAARIVCVSSSAWPAFQKAGQIANTQKLI